MKSKIKSQTGLYYLGLFLTTISSSLIGRTYLFLIPNLNPIIKYGAIICFLLSFTDRRWTKKGLYKSVLMIMTVLAVAVVTDSNILVIYILAIVLSRPRDFNKICKFLFWTNLCIFFVVLGMCGIGVLKDEITIHYGRSAHSLGFTYYSSPAYTVFFLTVLAYYLYSGKPHTKRRFIFILCGTIANICIYKITTVRLTFYIFFIFIGLIVLYEYIGLIRKRKFNVFLATFMYPVMFLLSIILPFVYTRSSFLVKLDEMMNGRFFFSMMGFTRYNVNMFGNQIITDAGGLDENWHNTYFYIDSGYVVALLGYGIIVCLALLLAYIMISRFAAIEQNNKLFVWCALVCVFAFPNNPLADIILNPLLFMTVPMIDRIRKDRKFSRIFGIKRMKFLY